MNVYTELRVNLGYIYKHKHLPIEGLRSKVVYPQMLNLPPKHENTLKNVFQELLKISKFREHTGRVCISFIAYLCNFQHMIWVRPLCFSALHYYNQYIDLYMA